MSSRAGFSSCASTFERVHTRCAEINEFQAETTEFDLIIVVTATAVVIISLYFHIFLSLKIQKFGSPSRGARSDETESSGSVQQFWVPQGWWTKGSSS
jgi:hypothetical protein